MTRSARGVAPRYPIPLHRWAAMLRQPCPDPLDVPEPVARLYELLARLGAGASEPTWQADTSTSDTPRTGWRRERV